MIITSSKILLKPGLPPIKNGAVAYRQGTILDVGLAAKIVNRYPGHRVIRLDGILMPGLINVHTHLELPPLLETISARSLPDWVLNLIRAKKTLTQDDYVAATLINIESVIRTGTTTVSEICTHNASPSLLKQACLRAVVFREFISMNPSIPVPRFESLLSRPSKLIQFSLSPHAPHTVSEEALKKIMEIAVRKKLRLCMHVAESKDEINLLQGKKSGFEKLYQAAGWDRAWAPAADSSFEYLSKIGLLGPHFLAVHAVKAKDADIKTIKKTNTAVAHCPRSNKETGVGKMQLKKFLDAGITVGLGTDSLASSPTLNMWDEMRYAYKIHRGNGITARDIFSLATIGGARALGMEKIIGSIEPGKQADLIAVPLPKKNTGDIYSDLLRETNSCIMSVVNGKVIYDDSQ